MTKIINCHELPMPTYHKYRTKYVKKRLTYVCHICGHQKLVEPSVTVVSPAMYKIIQEFIP